MSTPIQTRHVTLSDLTSREGINTHFSAKYGSYHHQYLTVCFDRVRSDENLYNIFGPLQLTKFKREHKNIEARVERAVEEATILHEFRHFHDAFGTLAGLSLFLDYMRIVHYFFEACEALIRAQQTWQFPVLDWGKSPGCPAEVKAFLHAYRPGQVFRQVFMGTFGLPEDPGPINDVFRRFVLPIPNNNDLDFFAFPSNYLRYDTESQARSQIVGWRPLGFEALLEGNAQALQRTMIESRWGKDVADRVWKRMTSTVAVLPVGQALPKAEELFGPYTVTDFLITRYLETKGIRQFDRTLVLDLTDAALMDSGLFYGEHPTKSILGFTVIHRDPGRALRDTLDRINWKPGSCPTSGALPSSQGIGRNGIERMERLIEQLRVASPEEMFSGDHYIRPNDAMLSYVIHKVVKPMIELRKRYGDGIFRNNLKYLANLQKFPYPPTVILQNGILPGREFSTQLRQKWIDFIMAEHLMHEIVAKRNDGKPIIFCPRATKAFPGASFIELEPQNGCNQHIDSMRCICWWPGRDPLPDCRFRLALDRLRVDCLSGGSESDGSEATADP